MKKIVFIALATVFMCSNAYAQEFTIGAKAGFNFSMPSGDFGEGTINTFNYNFGVVGRIGITDNIGIQPELLYSTQRYTRELPEYHLDYINLPIMGDFMVAKGFSLQVGPQIGFNVKSKLKFDAGDDTAEIDEELDVKTIDIGIGFGAQYVLPIDLFFQARYVFGLTNTLKDFDGATIDSKNAVLSLSVGYFFD